MAEKKIVPEAGSGRKQRGRVDRSVMFPVPPPVGDMPADYAVWLADIKARIHRERLRVVLASNAVMVLLYWDVGRSILDKQADQGWGSRVIDRLAADLRDDFPEMKWFSPRNLKYMRAFAAAWPERQIVQAWLAQLSWRQNLVLIDKLADSHDRLWYAAQSDRAEVNRLGNPQERAMSCGRRAPRMIPGVMERTRRVCLKVECEGGRDDSACCQ